jgi:DNA-binding beta-propeller fold protein YncE
VINGATSSVISSISVGSWPTGMAYDCANNYLYVANSASKSISIISASTYENNPYSLLIGVIAIVIVVALMAVGFVMGTRKIKSRY